MKIFALCNSKKIVIAAVSKLKSIRMLSGVGYLDIYPVP